MEALNPTLEFLFRLIMGIKNGLPLAKLLDTKLESASDVEREF